VLRDVGRRRGFVPVRVRDNLTWAEVARVEVHSPDLPGISIEAGETRDYPFGEPMAHVIGYVAAVAEKDLTGDPLLELPGFRIGKSGTERQYDLLLRGTAGTSQIEVNAFGRVIRELNRQEGKPGNELVLTLDTEGPRWGVIGTRAKYRERHEFVDADHRTTASSIQNEDGSWFTFLRTDCRRKSSHPVW